jgi:hypothetical protein
VAVAPIYSGLDGGMNEIFHAQFPGKIVPLAIVLPPGSGPELPQMPPVPWTDNDGSLANRLFRALINAGTVAPGDYPNGLLENTPIRFPRTGPPLIMFIGWGIL